jgi:Ca2+-binding EF-hand superfamily protein
VLPFQRAVQRQTLESMLTGLRSFDDLPSEIPPAQAQALRLALGLLDRNKNGRLDEDEIGAVRRLVESIVPAR